MQYITCMKLLNILLIFLLLISCNKEEEKPQEDSVTPLVVQAVGFTNFGKVPVSDIRVAGIKVTNNTGATLNISPSGTTAEFSHTGYQGCSNSSLPNGATCVVKISFSPSASGKFSTNVTVAGTSVSYTGEGLSGGSLGILPASWNAGTMTVGQVNTRTFTVTNTGDTDIAPPVLSNSDFTVVFSNCPSLISSGSSCQMDIAYQSTLAETISNQTVELASGINVGNFSFSVVKNPGPPSGMITFCNIPTKLRMDGATTASIGICSVTDEFGNIVMDGTTVPVGATNATILGPGVLTLIGGQAPFDIQTTTLKSDIEILASIGQATGVISIGSASDEPFGLISFAGFNPNVYADGISSVILKTAPIEDANNNIVDDGYVVNYAVSGSASLVTPSSNTYNGESYIEVVCGTVAETVTVTATSYSASGSTTVNCVPTIPAGAFNIASQYTHIYFDNQGTSGLNETTQISIGPIKDASNNDVGAGFSVDVTINNGLCVDKSPGASIFTITTDADSIARFELSGNRIRGNIQISAVISAGTPQESLMTGTVFAIGDENYQFEENNNRLKLYTMYDVSQFNPDGSVAHPNSARWNEQVEHLVSSIESSNGKLFGFTSYSNNVFNLSKQIPNISQGCLQPINYSVSSISCPKYRYTSSEYFFGSTNVFAIGAGGNLFYNEIVNLGFTLGEENANGEHGISSNIMGTLYGMDRFVSYGGLIGVGYPTFTGQDLNNIISYSNVGNIINDNYIVGFAKQTPGTGIMSLGAGSYNFQYGDFYSFGGATYTNPDFDVDGRISKFIQDPDDSNSIKIKSIDPDKDPDPAVDSKISPRAGSIMYVSDDERYTYIIGGYTFDDILDVWVFQTDIWRADMTTNVWKRICDNCTGLNSFDFDYKLDHYTEVAGVSTLTMQRFADISRNSQKGKVIYDQREKRHFLFISNSLNSYEINLDLGVISPATTPFDALLPAQDVIYNKTTARYYAIKHGVETADETTIAISDIPLGNKTYFKAEFNMPTGATDYAEEMNFRIFAFGRARTDRDPIEEDFGVSVFIFNFDTNQYELLTTNNYNNILDAQSNAMTATINTNAPSYISSDDRLSLVILPIYNPGYQGVGGLVNGESEIKINFIEIEGKW